jgi:hypothetical protein
LGVVVREFSDDLARKKEEFSFSLKDPPGWFWTIMHARGNQPTDWFTPEANPVTVSVQSSIPPFVDGKREGVVEYGEITAQKISGGKSLLRLFPDEKYLREFQQGWELLCSEMARQGWIDTENERVTPDEPTANHTLTLQPPAPTDVPKTTRWSRSETLALATLFVTILLLIVGVLALPFLQELIQHFMYSATPTLTPVLVLPTPTP